MARPYGGSTRHGHSYEGEHKVRPCDRGHSEPVRAKAVVARTA